MRAETATMILNQASETGGKYIFSEKLDADFEQILTSTIRDNAVTALAQVKAKAVRELGLRLLEEQDLALRKDGPGSGTP